MKWRLLHRIIQILSHLPLDLVQFSNLLRSDAKICIYVRAHRAHHIVSCLDERISRWDDHITLFEYWVRRNSLLNLVECRLLWLLLDWIHANLIMRRSADLLSWVSISRCITSDTSLGVYRRSSLHSVVQESLREHTPNRISLLDKWYEGLAHAFKLAVIRVVTLVPHCLLSLLLQIVHFEDQVPLVLRIW